ncbi:hypothetical protein [Paenibacillus sonchi]|uniref:hypothetical protein n=1 Tax=Paenibacillus sonchi TaxID=373687 RepID=UPI001E43A972|nr:hypothetical protein [Paenibacillus sonchi]MCE3199065.1 hypothetical protein [Paenibacillus sonchi]
MPLLLILRGFYTIRAEYVDNVVHSLTKDVSAFLFFILQQAETASPSHDLSAAVADRKAVIDRRFVYSAGQRTEMPLFVPFPFIPGSIERFNGS